MNQGEGGEEKDEEEREGRETDMITINPVVTAMPRPQYVFGTISP
jgi:hypothetical protein